MAKPIETAGANIRLAFVTNILPHYWKVVLEQLASRYELRILLSTRMESNRQWKVDWGQLDVVLQRTLTLKREWKHPSGFVEPIFIHVPIDTVWQLRRFRPDVVFSTELGFRTLLACIYRMLFPRSRLLVMADVAESTEQGRGALRAVLRRFIASKADGFVVAGRSGAAYLTKLGVPQNKISKIGYASDLEKFLAIPLPRNSHSAHRLLYAGQLIDRKGLTPFLHALAGWVTDHADRAVEFVAIGDGPARQSLERIHLPSNLKVSFRGNMAFSELAAVYAEFGIFVFPSLADTWGVAVNEAMAAGLPVLGSTYSQAVQEMVRDGHNGWTFRIDDSEALFSAIDQAMNTTVENLNVMRPKARATAFEYRPEVVAANIGAAIDAALEAAGCL